MTTEEKTRRRTTNELFIAEVRMEIPSLSQEDFELAWNDASSCGDHDGIGSVLPDLEYVEYRPHEVKEGIHVALFQVGVSWGASIFEEKESFTQPQLVKETNEQLLAWFPDAVKIVAHPYICTPHPGLRHIFKNEQVQDNDQAQFRA